MKPVQAFLIWGLFGLGAGLAGPAHAQHVRFGIVFGIPAPWYYPPYYYRPAYYPAPLVVQQPDPAYVEQGQTAATSGQSQGYWWYYCADTGELLPLCKAMPSGLADRPGRSATARTTALILRHRGSLIHESTNS